MLDYGLKDKVALITGVNNLQGIGATTAFAFARAGAMLGGGLGITALGALGMYWAF